MTDYEQLLNAVEQYYGSGSDQWAEIAKYGVASENAESILSQVPGVHIVKNADGTIRSYNFAPTENIASGAEQAVNSNTPAVIKSFEVPANTGIETVTTPAGETVKQMTFKSGMAQAGDFVYTEVVPAISAACAGITLGKTFDKLLYSANPDFWDEHGMSTLDPDKWGEIIGTDSAGGRFLNMILGTTPDNKTQAYIDQNALAYMALYMQQKGVFDKCESAVYENDEIKSLNLSEYIDFPIKLSPQLSQRVVSYKFDEENPDYGYTRVISTNAEKIAFFRNSGNNTGDGRIIFSSKNPSKYGETSYATGLLQPIPEETDSLVKTEIHNHTIYRMIIETNLKRLVVGTLNIPKTPIPDKVNDYIAYALLYGDTITSGGIDGVGTQDNAKTPDLSNADTVEDVLNALKSQYPELFQNAVTQNVVQPDGTIKPYTYVPVAMPELDPEGNPISSPSTQANPNVDPATATEPLLKLIVKLLQKDPPVNPPDTGKGHTPIVTPPTGASNALYSIYNPTQSQLNSFGAWLWSSNFVDQILKVFSDPMQAIIGLHKVFAKPSISGTGNIKVGYLDSGVSSNIVGGQYTTVDCGSVNLYEYYGNVFDYDPYTKINLYLPFIGIVPLNTGEVMRSAIHVVYHIDVLTGACLAEVKIIRDMAGGTLYQYTGNAAVQYPISSGSYMGIVSGILSIAGGIAGTIATGGAAMPVLLGAGASVGRMHTDISHSGSFSGNAGAMGIKKPYLIIDRPQSSLANNFQNYIGYPSNHTDTLGSCSGYVRVKEVHLEGIPATQNELNQIESILKEGVII